MPENMSFFETAVEEQSNGKHHDASNRSTKVSKRLRNDTSAEAPAEQVPCTSISNLEKIRVFLRSQTSKTTYFWREIPQTYQQHLLLVLIPLSKWILFNDPWKNPHVFFWESFFAGIFLGKKSTPKITGKVVERLKRFLVEDWVIVWKLMKGFGRCSFPKCSNHQML